MSIGWAEITMFFVNAYIYLDLALKLFGVN